MSRRKEFREIDRRARQIHDAKCLDCLIDYAEHSYAARLSWENLAAADLFGVGSAQHRVTLTRLERTYEAQDMGLMA